MPARSLTPGEIQLLQPIFGQTLPYDTQIVDTNDSNVGGIGNSITPNGTPYFSNNIWVMDFSVMIIPMISKWIFIHEFYPCLAGLSWNKPYCWSDHQLAHLSMLLRILL
jgi:hypothetical protein